MNYNICLYSSFVFLINVIVALYYRYYVYAGLFFMLTISSLFYHTTYTTCANIFDKIMICAIILWGGVFFIQNFETQMKRITLFPY